MAWNEPGKQDPWKSGKNQRPPDLDKLFKQFQQKLKGVIKNTDDDGNYGGGENGPPTAGVIFSIISTVSVIILAIWFFMGFYLVKAPEKGVVLRFGEYTKTVGAGLHWLPVLIDTVIKVNTKEIDTYTYAADMLTEDENIVSVEMSVQYQKTNPEAFLFNVADPIGSLQQATASALRQVIGHTKLDAVLTYGKEEVRNSAQKQLINLLHVYKTGITVTDVNLQPAKAPEEVKDAFDDAIKAQEDEQRFIKQARAYENQIIPAAYGKGKRLVAGANAYQQQVVLLAKGSTAQFVALLPEYLRAPKVMRERMYLSTIEDVLQHNHLIFVDVATANNLLYLPIDKMLAEGHEEHTASMTPIMKQAPTTGNRMITTSTPQASNQRKNSSTPSGYLSVADREGYTGRY